MKTSETWLDKNRQQLRDGVRSDSAANWFKKLVRRIQADTLDTLAADFAEKMKDTPNAPHQLVAEIRIRAREVEPRK